MSEPGEVSEGKESGESKQNKSGSVLWGILHITAFAFNFLTRSRSRSAVRGLIEHGREVKY